MVREHNIKRAVLSFREEDKYYRCSVIAQDGFVEVAPQYIF